MLQMPFNSAVKFRRSRESRITIGCVEGRFQFLLHLLLLAFPATMLEFDFRTTLLENIEHKVLEKKQICTKQFRLDKILSHFIKSSFELSIQLLFF